MRAHLRRTKLNLLRRHLGSRFRRGSLACSSRRHATIDGERGARFHEPALSKGVAGNGGRPSCHVSLLDPESLLAFVVTPRLWKIIVRKAQRIDGHGHICTPHDIIGEILRHMVVSCPVTIGCLECVLPPIRVHL